MVTEEIRKWLDRPPAVRGVRIVEDMFVIGTDIGKSREENQDRVAVLKIGAPQRNRTSWCACVCDGMGGMKDGGQAASLALASFFSSLITNRRLEPHTRLETAAREASDHVSKNVSGGGATLSGVLLEEGSAFTVNVGDSRIYRLAETGEIDRLTVDDTLAEAFGGEDRGLLQYIGSKSRISPHVKRLDDLPGELIVTSDGAHLIGDQMLSQLNRHAPSISAYCERVLDLANWIGGKDNASFIATSELSKSASRSIETLSDISVWSVDGRLKITWVAGKHGLPVEAEPKAQNAFPPDKVLEPVEIRTDETSGANKSKKKKLPKVKKEQIEIGFSDEGTK